MQGNLNEIDIRSILQLIQLGQRTGELFVETYQPTGTVYDRHLVDGRSPWERRSCWFVFFLNGRIVYATSAEQGTQRLKDYLGRYGLEEELDSAKGSADLTVGGNPEYSCLWMLLEQHRLDPAQGRTILDGMIRETLFDLLSLHSGTFAFEIGPALAPQLTTFDTGQLAAQCLKQVQQWKQFYPHIQSPDQCPLLVERDDVQERLAEQTFKTLSDWATGAIAIRKIARTRNRDIPTVARVIMPYVQQGIIQLIDPPTARVELDRKAVAQRQSGAPLVACVEDSQTVRQAIEKTLQVLGYRTAGYPGPISALGALFDVRPDLILCDISMPELDGYELCAMLRQSSIFRRTPIVMLTGLDGFLDRIHARTVGATDYLTKPFKKHELRALVERYAGPAHLETFSTSIELGAVTN
ncbi:MAG: response regulator [Cyanophyceae cyanobacterium]